MIHVETSFLIRSLVRGSREDHRLREWLGAGTEIGLSTLAWTEFLCGPVDSGQIELVKRITGDPVPFIAEDGMLAARLFNSGGRRRGSLIDAMIAAVAVRSGARLATSNTADFVRWVSAGLDLA